MNRDSSIFVADPVYLFFLNLLETSEPIPIFHTKHFQIFDISSNISISKSNFVPSDIQQLPVSRFQKFAARSYPVVQSRFFSFLRPKNEKMKGTFSHQTPVKLDLEAKNALYRVLPYLKQNLRRVKIQYVLISLSARQTRDSCLTEGEIQKISTLSLSNNLPC